MKKGPNTTSHHHSLNTAGRHGTLNEAHQGDRSTPSSEGTPPRRETQPIGIRRGWGRMSITESSQFITPWWLLPQPCCQPPVGPEHTQCGGMPEDVERITRTIHYAAELKNEQVFPRSIQTSGTTLTGRLSMSGELVQQTRFWHAMKPSQWTQSGRGPGQNLTTSAPISSAMVRRP
jgi:hypothetical protein